MTIGQKISAYIGGILVLIAGAAVFAERATANITAVDASEQEMLTAEIGFATLEGHIKDTVGMTRVYQSGHLDGADEQNLRDQEDLRGALAGLETLVEKNPSLRADIDRLKPFCEEVLRTEERTAKERAAALASGAKRDEFVVETGELINPKLQAVFDEMRNSEDAEYQAALKESAAGKAEATNGAYACLTIMLGYTLGVGYLLIRQITGNLRIVMDGFEAVASGNLQHKTVVTSADEVGVLAAAFNQTTAALATAAATEKEARARIERLLASIRDASERLATSATQVLAATSEQAAGAQEQAAAVSETVATVHEVAQTAEQASLRAKSLAGSAARALEIGASGRRTVDETVASMMAVKEQVEGVAATMLALAERAQAIVDITETVDDIAEQTNILALNASIEASRAGEHGRGFAVVAGEVRALAVQSKQATVNVRKILGEIQKATHNAVMATDDGAKTVNTTVKVALQAGEVIRSLTESLDEANQSATQIVASASQQATGMVQVQQAMRSIDQVTSQSLAATRQTGQAANDLNALGKTLRDLLSGHGH